MKLLPSEVRAIRDAYATGFSSKEELAEKYGVSEVWIWKMVHGETWRKRAGGPIVPPPRYCGGEGCA